MATIRGGKVIEGSGLGSPLLNAGAPTSGAGGTYAGTAVVGSLLIDTANGALYICTNATVGASFAWTQLAPAGA
ncbi:hypothetical protein MOQ72_29125 [Saccharopolyspora sp. K220]|uniref:hypothetical protein n=1 Tax=Saccharopolyspora soli TaxID=2926618 RepID=UPI001F56E090|nr:hypothetical protein [Saccharopolyspora soli]MCI2421504.1 hypothetical protein [Saccharopolyspora soli]